MKRILLRTLKEIGRLSLIIVVLLSWGFISHGIDMLFSSELHYCNTNNCMPQHIKFSRIVSLIGFVIMASFLFILIRHKKLSKLWLIEGLLLLIAIHIIAYITTLEPQNMISEEEQQHIIIERE